MMVPETEKPRITEIKVRMDCNGCVQKIKKALHGITGIQDIYIDFPQQKITIIGWAEPEKIVKAIKKTRKSAVICLHTEQQPDQPAPEGEAPPPDPTTPPPEPTQPEPTEPQKEQPQPENPPPEPNPSPENANATPRPEIGIATPSQPKDQEEVHIIHHHPPDYGYRYPNFQQGYNGQWNSYHGGLQFRAGPTQPPQPPQPVYVTHSYNTYQPSPYVTEYAYAPSPPRYSRYNAPDNNTHYSAPDNNTRYSAPENNTRYSAPDYNTRYSAPDYNTRYSAPDYNVRYSAPDPNTHNSLPDYYNRDYYSGNNGNGNITSMFSEENPNACRIV
ncbi:heavy metal-associated isoprenylated plant protein 26 [Phtheirospermum japonicum]|uniref:Heavy metal-associated isoprenylated plant protein 26 n=1 Tax=Phtheirospermum japonicum TaxID=374723 RepID=A0A830D7D6_9LAMI|nr:heavy metal-associated isoprenylated plant protein 26 [Phtheirospermum japonicum]